MDLRLRLHQEATITFATPGWARFAVLAIATLAAGCGEVELLPPVLPPGPAAPARAALLAGANAGDGGPALSASLEAPIALATGPSGEIYVADRFRVRRLEATRAATVPGSGPGQTVDSPAGVAADTAGNVYVTDLSTNGLFVSTSTASALRRLNADPARQLASEEDDIPLRSARLRQPTGLAADAAGNIYVSETGSHRVRIVERVADPDPERALRIRSVAGTRAVSGFSGDGFPATQALLCSPLGVTVAANGNVLFADSGNHRIRQVSSASGAISTVAGTGPACGSAGGFNGDLALATATRLDRPEDVAVAAGNRVLLADTGNQRVRAIDPISGVVTTAAGNGVRTFSGDGLQAPQASLGEPSAVLALGDGSFLVADTLNHRVRRVGPDGVISTFAGAPGGLGEPLAAARLSRVTAVAVDASNRLVFGDSASIRRAGLTSGLVELLAGNGLGGRDGDGGPAISARIRPPAGLAVDSAGNLFFSDAEEHVVRRVDAVTRRVTTVAGTPLTTAFIGDGNQATAAGLFRPRGLAVDRSGNLFIADEGHHAVRVVDRFGVIFTAANRSGLSGATGDGGDARDALLSNPADVAIEPRTGNLYIADTGNDVIRMVFRDASSRDGTIVTTPTAALARPVQVDVDASGNLAILDVDTSARAFKPILVSAVAGGAATGATTLKLDDRLDPDFTVAGVPDASLAVTRDRRVVVSDGKRIAAVGY